MTINVKICGLTSKEAVDNAVASGADYVGFVFFAKSPRNISAEKAAEISDDTPSNIKKVAVTVNMSDAELDAILQKFQPDFLQCHGAESPDRISEIKKKYKVPVIKAVAIRNADDVVQAKAFENIADMLLFDAKVPNAVLPGGNGLAFDWDLLKERKFNIPWFLSGGLNSDNVVEALSITKAGGVDVSSSVESLPGVKDPKLVREFVEIVKGSK